MRTELRQINEDLTKNQSLLERYEVLDSIMELGAEGLVGREDRFPGLREWLAAKVEGQEGVGPVSGGSICARLIDCGRSLVRWKRRKSKTVSQGTGVWPGTAWLENQCGSSGGCIFMDLYRDNEG